MNESPYELSEDLHVTNMWHRKSRVFEGFKTGFLGAVCGGIVVTAVGFTLGGWVTGEFADDRAKREAARQVLETKIGICLGQFKQDPDWTQNLTDLQGVQTFARPALVARAGWATMPGAVRPDPDVARGCADAINRSVGGD